MKGKSEGDIKRFLKASSAERKKGINAEWEKALLDFGLHEMRGIPIGRVAVAGLMAIMISGTSDRYLREQMPELYEDGKINLLRAYDQIKNLLDAWDMEERE